MNEGGLEKVTITMKDKNRGTIKLGNKRLLDIVTAGEEKLAEYKEKHGDAVTVSARELQLALSKLMS